VLERRLARVHPGAVLRQHAQRLDELESRMKLALRSRLNHQAARHDAARGALLRASPLLRLAALRLRSLVVVRPSLLSGHRDEFRLAERVALIAARPLQALIPAGVRPIAAADVARAMADAALADAPPAVIDSATMQGAGRRR